VAVGDVSLSWVADQFGWKETVEMVAKYYNALPPEETAAPRAEKPTGTYASALLRP